MSSKSQKREERQQRRAERRLNRQKLVEQQVQIIEQKKKKSLPGFLGKYRHEISNWLWHYMYLMIKAEDAGVPYIKDMNRDQRNDFIQEYVDVSTFRTELESYLKDENAASS